jgi:uncharacterized protein (TIGR02217 family)
MSAFRDVYLPDAIRGFPFTSSPRMSTSITQVASGDEHRNINWKHPLHRFSAPEAVKCMEDVEDLRDHWLVMQGPAFTFPFRDPFDFASRRLSKVNLEPTVGITDQVIGIGDGLTRVFQLQKTYTRGGFSYVRPIRLPIMGSVVVGMNGHTVDTPDPVLPGGPYVFDVTRYGGTILFDHAPHVGEAITAGFFSTS